MKYIWTILILGQFLMATNIEYLEVNNQKIPVIFEEDKRLPLVNMQFIFQNSGSITDDAKAGLAKFSAKLMNEGTKKLGSSKFAEALEAKAIHISSSTGKETFVMEVGCLKDEFDNALGFFAKLLKDPNFTDDAMQKIKTTTVGGLTAKENDFDYIASNELKSIMFKNTPLEKPSSGTIESIKSITLDDVKGFIGEHLVSSRLIIAVGGDVDLDELKEKLSSIINDMEVGKAKKLKHFKVVDKSSESILIKDTQQAYLYFGSPYNITADAKTTTKLE